MRTFAFIFLAFFLGGLAWGFKPDQALLDMTPGEKVQSQNPQETKQQIHSELGTFAVLAQELKPSVVNISVLKRAPQGSGEPYFDDPSLATGQGSGVIISADGDVLTNNHVVAQAKAISVKLSDGRELDADIVGTDQTTDLALLKIKDTSDLPVATLGNSDVLAVGDWVMAIGNPFGLEATVTVGVLSGKGRVIGAGPYDDFLQTDASINPGNSGGPLFNTKGEVIGINTAIVPGGQGIGFSIPINIAKDVSTKLKNQGRVVRGFIGVGIQSLTPALKSALGLPENATGALVSSLVDKGPAQQAGLETSDVIVAIDNNRILNDRDLLLQVAKLPIGKEIPFTVLRNGAEETLFITIVERPEEQTASNPNPDPYSDEARIGIAVTDLNIEGQHKVVVAEVVPASPGAKAGLKRGDFVRAVGSVAVSSAQDFVERVAQSQGDLALLIERQGRTSYLVVKD